MKIFKKITIFLLLFLSPNLLYGATSGASFLKINPGARAVGLGGAYNSLSNDISCLYFNPAGIAPSKNPGIGVTHTEWISDIRYEFTGGILPLKSGNLGISFTLLTMGELEGRGEDRQETADFEARDFALGISRGFQYAPDLMLGGTLKLIHQKIADENTASIAVDAGVIKDISNNFKLGLSIRNLGPGIKFLRERYSLPLTVGTGISYRYGGLLLSADNNYEVIDKNINFKIGAEWSLFNFMSVRGGYLYKLVDSLTSENDNILNEGQGLAGGLGLGVGNYQLDYAILPFTDLGNTHRVSFEVRF